MYVSYFFQLYLFFNLIHHQTFSQEFLLTFLQEGKPLRFLALQQNFSPKSHFSQGRLNYKKIDKVGIRRFQKHNTTTSFYKELKLCLQADLDPL